MLHHVTLQVADIERCATFYDSLLRPLGWRRQIDDADGKAWGIVKPVFFINRADAPVTGGAIVTFGASGIAAVKASWEQGVVAGGTGEDAPSQRPEQGAAYYSAVLKDPDGNILEVVVHPD